MANTYLRSKGMFTIGAPDSDWLWSTTYPGHKQGIPVWSIAIKAHAAGTICILREDSITGPIVFHKECVAVGDQVPSYFGGELIRLAFDFSEGVYGANAVICIKLAHKI